ncbi:MAG: hypothetical protein UY96_C0003G0052 [Parcubacteria group bacterium GW2011_GWB1_56_8]|nr:MAG: hypothetical protein UY96_C0003G0052 [Parcubacteria group bacterium GW2011_GWB1_56_8]
MTWLNRILVGALCFIGMGLLLTLCSGCGKEVPYLLRTAASTSVVVSGGYRAINAYDKTKQDKIRLRAVSGDPKGATAEFDEYTAKRDFALKLLDNGTALVEKAYNEIPVIAEVVDAARRKQLTELVKQLIKLGLDVAMALDAIGIKIGGLP